MAATHIEGEVDCLFSNSQIGVCPKASGPPFKFTVWKLIVAECSSSEAVACVFECRFPGRKPQPRSGKSKRDGDTNGGDKSCVPRFV